MKAENPDAYTVSALSSPDDDSASSVSPSIPPGTNLLLTGPGRLISKLGTRLALEGTASTDQRDGVILVSTNQTVRNFARWCRGTHPEFDMSRIGYVDATGHGDDDMETEMAVRCLSSTGDLTGISIGVSVLYSAIITRDIERVRHCYNSLSYLLLYTKPKTVVRFAHTMSGRVSATEGVGFFTLDPSMHDERVVRMLEHTFDGQIRVEIRDGVPSYRLEGIAPFDSEWTPLEGL